jgi:hypothetical protein
MAYVPPTATTFKARFSEFAPVSDVLVDLVLAEAIDQVGDTWLERDRARAQMLLAAHTLTLEGEPGRTTTGVSSASTGTVKRRKVGDVEVEFAGVGSGSGASGGSGFASTTYGVEYLALMRKNFPTAIAV